MSVLDNEIILREIPIVMEFTRDELAEVGVDIEDLHEITHLLHDHIKWQGDEIRLVNHQTQSAATEVATGTTTLEKADAVKRKTVSTSLAIAIPVAAAVAGVVIGGPVGGVIGASVASGLIGAGVGGAAGLGVGIGVKKIIDLVMHD